MQGVRGEKIGGGVHVWLGVEIVTVLCGRCVGEVPGERWRVERA
jgi:hypothetical protein